MNIVIISDSFKGAVTSREAHIAIAAGVRRALPHSKITEIPVADGGEGTVDAMLAAAGGDFTHATVCGVFPGEQVEASFGFIDSHTAVVEMAACAGLPLAEGRKDTTATTTFGVGELIRAAVDAGATHVVVGAGGSATTDLGCGAASALGVSFLNTDGEEFVPVGGTLKDVAAIDTSRAEGFLAGVSITVMSDIDNPLVGPTGAAHVFGPQKGADRATVDALDAGLTQVAETIHRDLGLEIANVPGAGAAGGLAGGLMAFCGAEIRPGIDVVLDAVNFPSVIADADLVITGEGQIDGQSLAGKVPVGVARWSLRHRNGELPVVVLAGSVGADVDRVYAEGVTAVFPIGRTPGRLEDAIARTRENLEAAAQNVVRLIALAAQPRDQRP
ncbi:glycerate kinase family protein [Corynebacterium suedekumii]|uniref:Glycerate kinase n=1 Tax=Corynebacterium suedekumii TaxID=3049801 RepID=A0ABY8VJV7_9CORY|nr:glycerate kinase [Corynebacterium suedekumii]WIM69778.1 glycerate kinase [Corynebacterium suedekumii]